MKIWKYFMFASVLTLGTIGFTACGGDDDDPDDEGSSSGGSSMAKTIGNRQLHSVDDYILNYNDDGTLASVSAENGMVIYKMTYKGSKMTMTMDLSMQGYIAYQQYVCTVSDGLIKSMVMTFKSVDDGDTTEGSETFTFGYKNSQMTSAEGKYSMTEKSGSYSIDESGSGKVALTWSGGNLVKMESSSTSIDNSESMFDNSTMTYDYSNAVANKYGQASAVMTITNILEYLGFFGDWGSEFPTSMTEVSENTDDGNRTYTTTYQYTIDSEGYLTSFKEGSETTYLTYSGTRSVNNTQLTVEKLKKLTAVPTFRTFFKR